MYTSSQVKGDYVLVFKHEVIHGYLFVYLIAGSCIRSQSEREMVAYPWRIVRGERAKVRQGRWEDLWAP